MKLSMWIIATELEKKYEVIPLISVGERTLESVRTILDDDFCVSSEAYIYIGKTNDYFHGYFQESIILASGRDIVFVCKADLIEVLNDVVVIFDKYRSFDDKLTEASSTDNPFQDMLNVIHSLFNCPMFFGQKDLRIYALTEQYSDAEVYDGWEDVKKYHTMPIKVINSTNAPDMTKYPDSIKTVAIPVSENEGKHFKYQIRSNVYRCKKLWGHLYIYYNHADIPMSVVQLARYCADAYGALLDRLAGADASEKYAKYTFLIEKLDGNNVDVEKINNLAWQMNWQSGQKLRLYKIAFSQKQDSDVFFEFTLTTIESEAKNKIVFPYKKSIIVITADNGKKADDMFISFRHGVLSDKYICGISYSFESLTTINYAYFQASFALDWLIKNPSPDNTNYFYYDDCAFPGLITFVRKSIDYRSFIEPSLIELYELDKATGTEYYRTLFWLLANNGHVLNTAKQLYIHRNTLKYRLDKIVQIVHQDIYDSDVSAYLRLCYSLMIEDYPVAPSEPCQDEENQ